MSEIEIVEQGILEETLTAAMQSGGSFAEVFIEDKRSTTAVLDDGLVEELNNGRDRLSLIHI